MKLLEQRILKDATVLPGNVLKIDNFLNHQIDVALIDALGEEFYRLFSEKTAINKILTVESSGIAIACAAARYFKVPVVFAKKGHHANVGDNVYHAEVYSYTKAKTYEISVSKNYLTNTDKVLIIDDFLANGAACKGMLEIIESSGAELCGVGIAVEKGFQPGGKQLREAGITVKSLAIVDSMEGTSITFREND